MNIARTIILIVTHTYITTYIANLQTLDVSYTPILISKVLHTQLCLIIVISTLMYLILLYSSTIMLSTAAE